MFSSKLPSVNDVPLATCNSHLWKDWASAIFTTPKVTYCYPNLLEPDFTWAVKNTPIPPHYTGWLIEIQWMMIIPNKTGSIIPCTSQ